MLRLRVTNDNASTDLRAMVVAIECRDHPQDETADTTAALAYECEDLTPMGGAEVVEVAGASGGKVVEHDDLTAGWLTILGSEIDGVGHMTHKGVRRLRFRVENPGSDGDGVQLRVEWRALGSLGWTPNTAVDVPLADSFASLDLGESRPEDAALGDNRWEFRLQARATSGSGAIRLDKIWPEPTEQRIVVRAPEISQGADAQSAKSPGTVASDSAFGDVAWTSPSNAKASDDSRATAVLEAAEPTTEYLKATNFGFSLPEGAFPVGVVVGVERSADEKKPAARDKRVRLVVGGVISGPSIGLPGGEDFDKASPDTWPTTDAYAYYGGSDDRWAQSLTYANVNASDFGVAIAAEATGFGENYPEVTARIDHVTITVYYTEADDENRVCFAERSIEFRSDGVYRQHPDDEVWGRLVPEDGFYLYAPAGGLGGRMARAIVVPSQGDLDELPDEGTNKLSAVALLRPAFLFARESGSE